MAKTNWGAVVVFAALVVAGIFVGTHWDSIFAAKSPGGGSSGTTYLAGTGSTSLYVSYLNGLNSTTTNFVSGSVNVYDGKELFGPATTKRDTDETAAYSSAVTVNTGETVDLYATSTTTLNSVKKTGVKMDKPNVRVKLIGSNSSIPTLKVLDSTLANYSTSAAQVKDIVSQTATLGSGGSITEYLDIEFPTGASQFGGPENGRGVHVSVYLPDTTKIDMLDGFVMSTAFAFPGITKVPCLPSAVSKNNAKVCYDMPALVAGQLYRQQYRIYAKNDPADAASPVMYFDDYQHFWENGEWHYDIKTADGTDVGAAQLSATLKLA